MGDFDLQPLFMSVENLLNSQIKFCFTLPGRNHAACKTVNEHADDQRYYISRESKQWCFKLPDL